MTRTPEAGTDVRSPSPTPLHPALAAEAPKGSAVAEGGAEETVGGGARKAVTAACACEGTLARLAGWASISWRRGGGGDAHLPGTQAGQLLERRHAQQPREAREAVTRLCAPSVYVCICARALTVPSAGGPNFGPKRQTGVAATATHLLAQVLLSAVHLSERESIGACVCVRVRVCVRGEGAARRQAGVAGLTSCAHLFPLSLPRAASITL